MDLKDKLVNLEDLKAVNDNMQDNLAPAYSSSGTYAVGTHVMYNGDYYVCNTAITTAEAWTAAHWTKVTVGGEAYDLKSAIAQDAIDNLLQVENIFGTTQSIVFDSAGNVQSITHKDGNNNTVRTDAFTFAANSITETRTLSTGESLTIVTNLTTLETTTTYSAA